MQRGKVLVRAMFRAATNRLNLCLSGAAVLSALMLQSGALGAMALGGYLAAVAIDLSRPHRWREAMQELRRSPPDLPSSGYFSDPTVRDLLSRIEKARTGRQVVERNLAPTARAAGQTLLERACALEEAGARLLHLLERVSCYLGTDPIAPVRQEMARLRRVSESAQPRARAEYEAALRAGSGRVAALEYADGCRALLQAKLEAIVGGLEALAPALMAVELRESTATALADEPPLPGLLDELDTLEEAASTVTAAS
jgi:hypothetical protein